MLTDKEIADHELLAQVPGADTVVMYKTEVLAYVRELRTARVDLKAARGTVKLILAYLRGGPHSPETAEDFSEFLDDVEKALNAD